jgi:hypothetical protein
MKEYKFRRYAAGVSAVRQGNRAAPVKRGWWAFPAGWEKHAGNVPAGVARRWHTLIVPADALIFVGWDRRGVLHRDGFFNVGPWQYMSVEDAMLGFERIRAHTLSIVITQPQWRGFLLRKAFDADHLQCFIPAAVNVR